MFVDLIKFIKAKWTLRTPPKKKILIYDAAGDHLSSLFFQRSIYHLLKIRFEEINILIMFKAIKNFGVKNLKQNYIVEYINQVQPTLIINFLDNNLRFYTLKKFYKKGNFVSIQTSSRDNSFFLQCKDYYKKSKIKLETDNFFVISKNDKKRFSKFISSDYHIIGTLKNNLFYKVRDVQNKKKKVLFISQQNYGRAMYNFIEEEKKIFNELYKLAYKKNWTLTISTKNPKKTENSYRKNLIKGNWKFLSALNPDTSYKAINTNDLIIFTNSTLGLEALIKNKKCISFPPDYFPFKGFNLKYTKNGPFWSCEFSKDKLITLINKVESFNKVQWNKLIKKYIYNIMAYDPKNKTFFSFLKKYKIKPKNYYV